MMNLETCANIASIVTPLAGLCVWLSYRWELRQKRKKLELFLKLGTAPGREPYHTVPHLMQGLGMTEDELLRASYSSRHIGRFFTQGEDGFPAKLMFKYEENANALIRAEMNKRE